MSLKQLSLAVLVAAGVLTAPAFSQKYEVSVLLGRTFISDQGINGATPPSNVVHFGNGTTFEVNPARHLLGGDFESLGSITVEMPIVFNLDEDMNSGTNNIPAHFRSIFATPALRANAFPRLPVSPWGSFGGGFGHFSESSTLVYGGPNPGHSGTTTGILEIGAGLDMRIKGLTIRGALRDFWSGVPELNVATGKSRQHNFFVGAGIVLHF
jgi:hypothetical protein